MRFGFDSLAFAHGVVSLTAAHAFTGGDFSSARLVLSRLLASDDADKTSAAVLAANCALSAVFLTGVLLRSFFFGGLTLLESAHASERSVAWASLKAVSLIAILPEPEAEDAAFIIVIFAWHGVLRLLCGLARDRFETASNSISTRPVQHARTLALVLLLLLLNSGTAAFIWQVFNEQWALRFLLLHDCFTLACSCLQLIVRFAVHLFEVFALGDGDESSSGEWRRSCIYATDTATETAVDLACILHGILLYWMHGLGIGVIDAVLLLYLRAVLAGFISRVSAFVSFLAVARDLARSYPDVSAEELAQAADVCAVCREALGKGTKRLPCSHLLHASCLRRWVEVKTACPICRHAL